MSSILVGLMLVSLACGLLYRFLVWNFGYWRKLGIKETKSWPFVGSFPGQFSGKRNATYEIDEMYNEHKKTEHFVGVINARVPQLLVISPDYVHKVYITDFRCFHDNEFANCYNRKRDIIFSNNPFVLKGTEWKECRAEAMPGFTTTRIAAVYPSILKASHTLVEYIRTQMRMRPPSGIDAKELGLRYTTEVVSDSVLGIKAESFTNNETPILKMIAKAFTRQHVFMTFVQLTNLFPIIRKIFLVRLFPKDVSDFFVDLMNQSLAVRKKQGNTDRVDFINYLLELQQKKHVNVTLLTSHALTFLINGYESSASTIAHTLLMLARYPRTQSILREEIGTKNLTLEELTDLPYLNACVMETLRLWPVLMNARKLCTEPCEFTNKDGTKILIKPGQVIIVPIYSIHHDPDIYEHPEEYRPERFLPENGGVKRYMEKGMYLSYGMGPRVCYGVRFAFAQVKAALVEILRNFDVKVNERTRNDCELEELSALPQLKGGIWLEFLTRS